VEGAIVADEASAKEAIVAEEIMPKTLVRIQDVAATAMLSLVGGLQRALEAARRSLLSTIALFCRLIN